MNTIAIAFPNKKSTSETFIKAHIDNLPCAKKLLYGGWFPKFSDGDSPLYAPSKLQKLVDYLMYGGRSSKARSEKLSKSLVKYLKRNRVEAVLAEYGPTGVALMDVCAAAQVPLIVHFHGFDAYLTETLEVYREDYKRMFQKAAAIIAVSRHMEQQLISLGAPRSKVQYNPYGVDINKFQPRDGELNDHPVFFYVGRFVTKKAPHLLILAFSEVVREFPAAKLIMAGDAGTGGNSELYYACKQLVRALNLTDRVQFTGALSPNEVSIMMKRAYAYVQHSVTPANGDSEGTPNAILEASASGLAVISTTHAGIVDVIKQNETGFLVPEYDVEAMAKKMKNIIRDPDLSRRMGLQGRQNIKERFSMDHSIERLWSIIERSIVDNK